MSGQEGPARAPQARGTGLGERPTFRSPADPAVPEFFIVGHPKCGTTALYEMLREHPQIFLPANKEPWFFASELHVRTPPRPAGTPQTLEEYLALFEGARPDQRPGEATPHYLWSATAAAAIAKVAPGAKIIAFLREPASFLHSLHLQFVETYVETESDLRTALALEPERRAGRQIPRHTYWPTALMYSGHVRYVEQLRRYHELFGESQVMVAIYDDFRQDNEATVRRVLRFLELDETVPVSAREVNPTVRPRSQRLHSLMHAVGVGRGPISRAVKGAVKAVTPAGPRRRAFYAAQQQMLFAAPKPPDEQLMQELRVRFRGEVQAISEFLDRDLVGLWGYDKID
jgi:hypothetical protein